MRSKTWCVFRADRRPGSLLVGAVTGSIGVSSSCFGSNWGFLSSGAFVSAFASELACLRVVTAGSCSEAPSLGVACGCSRMFWWLPTGGNWMGTLAGRGRGRGGVLSPLGWSSCALSLQTSECTVPRRKGQGAVQYTVQRRGKVSETSS